MKPSLAASKNRLGKSDLWEVFQKCPGPVTRQMLWKMAIHQHDPRSSLMMKEMLRMGGHTFIEIKTNQRTWTVPISGNEMVHVWENGICRYIVPHVGMRLDVWQVYQTFGTHISWYLGEAYIRDIFTT